VRITKQSEYGLAAILYLATQPKGTLSLRDEIARRCGIPRNFLARILVRLRRTGILGSRRGAHGGYFLRVEVQRLSLADVLEALEGKIGLLRSAAKSPEDGNAGAVRAHLDEAFTRLQERGFELLRSIKIGELLAAKSGHS
jgi:Rrf2 family protein